MVKKWTFAAIAYLVLVIGGYGIYTTVYQPDAPSQQHNEEIGH
jgi:hypothetical protein